MFAESLPVEAIAELDSPHVNSGGLFDAIRLLPISQVLNFTPPAGFAGQAELGAVELTDGAEWIAIPILYRSGTYSQQMAQTANGPEFQQNLSFVLPKDRPELAEWFNRHRRREWLAVIQDRNEYWRVVGTPAQPLTIETISVNTGNVNGRNARAVSMGADTENEAFFLHEDEM